MRAWRSSTASKAARRCARGSTGSRPTSASTCSSGRERRARPMDLGPAREPVDRQPQRAARGRRGSSRSRRSCALDGDPADVASPRDDPARVRRGAAAPAAAAARGADPLRGAALAGNRGRRAARDERRLGQQRAAARARHARGRPSSAPERRGELDEADRELLARYVDAFERYDIDALTSLIHEDATQSMPPFDMWLAGRDDIFTWWFGPGHRLPRLAA